MTTTAHRVARRYLQAAPAVDPLHPDEVEAYFATACKSLRRYARDFEVVEKSGPVRDPDRYDMQWRLRLGRDVDVAVMVSYSAAKNVRLQVSEKKAGKVERVLDERLSRAAQYKLMIESCLSHWYDRHQGPW